MRAIRDQCEGAGVAFFFKQWGGPRPKSSGRESHGREWNDFPLLHPSRVVAGDRSKKPKDTSVGPWAREKLDALREYLGFYTTVLKNQGHWLHGTLYVDAFAGPGLSRIRTKSNSSDPPGLFGPDPESDTAETEFLKGSPRVALEITNPFTSYLFVERDAQRIAELRSLAMNTVTQDALKFRKVTPMSPCRRGSQAGSIGGIIGASSFSIPSGCKCPGLRRRRSQGPKQLRF